MSKRLLDRLKSSLPDVVLETSSFAGDEVAFVKPEAWRQVFRFLRDDAQCACDYFVDLSAIDTGETDEDGHAKFEVYGIVYSIGRKHRIRVKALVAGDEPSIDSIVEIYQGANWAERECFDMFGVRFNDHPDLRRILLYPEFVGHPLRKSYPANKTQPLVPYREGTIDKIGPFLQDEGLPLNRSTSEDERQN